MANLTGALSQLREQRRTAQRQVDKLDEAIAAIEGLVGKSGASGASPRKRILSAAGRRRIALAQKARWAKFKAQQRKAA
jgi:hypothetical protein